MTGIDFYKSVDLDASLILKYPQDMSGVLTSMRDILKSRGKMVVEVEPVSVKKIRDLAANATGDTNTYYQVRSNSEAVWAALRDAVETDSLRVLGLVHGKMPRSLPQNVLTIDVGRSLHRKVSKASVSEVVDSLKTVGKYPTGDPEQLYYAVQALCYESMYDSEYRLFPKEVARKIPRAVAFKFMYSPPEVLTPHTMRSAVHRFVEGEHSGWVV